MTVQERRNTRAPASAWRPFVPKRPRSWGPEIAAATAFAVTTALLLWPSWLVDFDIWMRDLADAHRPDWLYYTLRVTIYTGQGGLLGGIALTIAAILALRGRSVRPLLAYLAAYLMVGSVLIIKWTTDRVAPHWPDHPPYADAQDAVLFSGLAPAQSYPAGHALNTIVWFGVIVILVGGAFTAWQRRLLLGAPPVIAFASMVHLGWHWFSDAPAGIFLGVIIIRIVQRIRWDTIELPTWLEPEKRYLLGHAPS